VISSDWLKYGKNGDTSNSSLYGLYIYKKSGIGGDLSRFVLVHTKYSFFPANAKKFYCFDDISSRVDFRYYWGPYDENPRT